MAGSLRAFADAACGPEPEIDLARAALQIASIEDPGLVPDPWLDRLDELAARSGACGVADSLRVLHRVREFLFEEEGFRGNVADYYDPRNSCLDQVLGRRLGIPITLALLMMEVGRRVGLRIDGIGLPGHFLVSAHVGSDRVLLDPFEGGAIMTLERAHHVVARATGRAVKLTEASFTPCSKRQILARMLTNLKAIYVKAEAWEKALQVVERLLLLDPDAAGHVRDRGSVLVRAGHRLRGIADWERYLTRYPDAPDADTVRQQLRRIRQEMAALN